MIRVKCDWLGVFGFKLWEDVNGKEFGIFFCL